MEKTIRGSLGAASAFQLTKDMEALDKQSRKILQYREVLAVILKETVEEYQEYSEEEIMAFIEADSIAEETEVSGGRTNTKIDGAATEFAELGEKTSYFDIAFRAKNPRLSDGEVVVNLYIDVEPQKDYRPGYPIEKRNAIERMIRAGVTKEQIVSFGYGEEFAEAESMMCQKV